MKNIILFSVSVLFFAAGSEATPTKLKCAATYQVKDQNGKTQTEKFSAEEQLLADSVLPTLNSAYATSVSADGRFQIQYWGFQDIANPETVRASIAIYDSKTKSGAQSGNPAIGSPSSPQNDLVYVFDSNGIKGPPENFVSGHCDIL
jgi:hypothetical protein